MLTKMRQRLAANEGFTLIELLVVIVIIGVLLAIAIPSYLSFKDKAEKSAAQANVRAIVPAIESHYSDNDTYAGMTPGTLKATYDQSIDTAKYKISGTTATTYCVQAKEGGHIASKSGPSAGIVVAKTAVDVC